MGIVAEIHSYLLIAVPAARVNTQRMDNDVSILPLCDNVVCCNALLPLRYFAYNIVSLEISSSPAGQLYSPYIIFMNGISSQHTTEG